MRKVLKSFVALFVIATMLLSMACVSFAADVTASSGEIVLSTNGVEEFTFDGESYTGVAVTVRAEIPDDYFLGWDEGRIFYDSSAFNYVGAEILDYADDWDDTYSWPLAPTPNAYPEENLVKTGLGAYDAYPYNSQDMMVLYFAVNGDVADYSEQTFEFTPGGALIAADTDMAATMPTTLTGASVTFPEAAPEVYTITYVIDGVTVGTQEYEVGAEVTALAAPEKAGYTFNGWVGVPATMPAENVTVTGSYTEIPATETSGTWGKIAWAFDEATGKLTITGNGAMPNASGSTPTPWADFVAEITEVEIAEGVTAIGNRAFRYAENLTSIDIPSTVTSIGSYAFQDSGLVTVSMPVTLTIGSYAFNVCEDLTTVNIAGTKAQYDTLAASIPKGNFEFQRANITITDEATGNVAHASMSIYATWVYDEATKKLEIGNCPTEAAKDMLNFKTAAEIPWAAYINEIETAEVNGVALLGSRSFYQASALKSADINAGSRINSWAFSYATALEEISLPASLQVVATGAFYGADALTKITTDADIATYDAMTIGSNNTGFKRTFVEAADAIKGYHSGLVFWYLQDGVLTLDGKSAMVSSGFNTADSQPWYPYKDQINSIVINRTVKEIGKYAFGGLTNVTEITIPSSITKVNAFAFAGMTGLETINMTYLTTTLGTSATSGCTNLKTVNYTGTAEQRAAMTVGSGNSAFTKAAINYID